MNAYNVCEHKPLNIDQVEGELDDLTCCNHLCKSKPELDITKIWIKNDELCPFICEQLVQNKDVIAKHEVDSNHLNLDPFETIFSEEDNKFKQGFWRRGCSSFFLMPATCVPIHLGSYLGCIN